MRRTPIRPSAKPIKRSRPPRARKPDPKTRRWQKHRCELFTDWLKTQPCCVTGYTTGSWLRIGWDDLNSEWHKILVDPAHTRPRSLGADDLHECVPLARHLHEEQERIRWPAFERKYGINRHALAKKYADEWLATPDGLGWLAQQEAT